jgi:hypothetical protein
MDKLTEKQRTALQNRCMWKYFEEVARECQNAGISPQVFIKAFSVDVTKRMVEDAWRAIIELKYGHSSTTQLTSRETSETYEEMNRGLSSLGLHVEWPSWDSVIYRENNK